MLRIKNTALDRTKTLLHRTAAKLEMEPMVNGLRLRLNTSMDVPEEWALKNKDYLESLIKMGVIEINDLMPGRPTEVEPKKGPDGLYLGGPTLELWMERGYPAEGYPPGGWAEVPSAGLTAYRQNQADAASAAEARKAEEEAELRRLEEEEAAAEEAAKEVVVDVPPPVPESAPVVEAPSAPAVEEKSDNSKKGSGKKKLF